MNKADFTSAKPKEQVVNTDPCVHCGFCLPTCASYRVLGTEMDSPRGRIHLLKGIENGELEFDSTVAQHFDTCLGCFACVTACPSGVRYDKLIEKTRPKLNKTGLRSSCKNIFRELLMFILPYPKRLRALLQAIRWYPGTSLQKTVQKSKLINLFGSELVAMESLLPQLNEDNFNDEFKVLNPAKDTYRGRVGLVLGCVQRCFDPEVNKASIEVLQANGFEVVIPKNQGCCGAVTHHQGRIEETRKLGGELLKSFNSIIKKDLAADKQPLEALLVAASGCGHTMKSYGEILDEQENLNIPILDIHEFLIQRGLSTNFQNMLRPLSIVNYKDNELNTLSKIAYHDACHMIHGQGIKDEPRKLLSSIPSINILEAEEEGVCCGSAGIYNLVQPKEASELGILKANDLTKTGAQLIASANIGCTLQIRRHINEKVMVAHPMQILAWSAGIHKLPGFIKSLTIS